MADTEEQTPQIASEESQQVEESKTETETTNAEPTEASAEEATPAAEQETQQEEGTAAEADASESQNTPPAEEPAQENAAVEGGESTEQKEADQEAETAAVTTDEQKDEQPEEKEEKKKEKDDSSSDSGSEKGDKDEKASEGHETRENTEITQEEEKKEKEEEEEKEEEAEQATEQEPVVQNGTSDHDEEGKDDPTLKISDEERERCRTMFNRKAVNDRLDLKGFKVLFRLMGEVLSTEDAEAKFEDGDRDDNGTIDFEEFCRLYCKFSEKEQERKEAVAHAIEKIFPTTDGKPVKLKKVEKLLLKLQKPDLSMRLVREKSDLGKDDVKKLVSAMDKDGNGLISKNEFVETLCSHLQL